MTATDAAFEHSRHDARLFDLLARLLEAKQQGPTAPPEDRQLDELALVRTGFDFGEL